MIKFPSVHIAESVLNRIMNLRDEVGSPTRTPPNRVASVSGDAGRTPSMGIGSVPGPGSAQPPAGVAAESLYLNQQVSAPPAPMALPNDPAMWGLGPLVMGGNDLVGGL